MTGQIEASFAGALGAFRLDVAFTVPASGVTALFGPSGCGKTTVLRCIAGLQRLERGRCVIAGDVWQDDKSFRSTNHRPIGYVFQEASLFPHLSVRRNLLFGAPRQGGQPIGFDTVVDLLRLEKLLDRSPHHLSGGERQRVAIGRALLSQPGLLLMDEPLSALDRFSREEILPFLEQLRDRLSLPILYVTHDMAEVEILADQLVLLQAGRVLACGKLAELQSDPSLPIASARDAAVSLDGIVRTFDPTYGLLGLDVAGGHILVPSKPVPLGERRRVRIAARDVSLATSPTASTILNVLPARIVSAAPIGQEIIAALALGETGAGATILARVTQLSWDRLGLAIGQQVHAQIKGVALT